ncbi:MAG: acyl CoA:acetate/3-ketoacid CoA transferase [Streptosporangiales bacterium]|nr:acyl CoA:acetate/3-ketoacid CoA transferase [Streptosporangiales bacterium]
MPTRPVPLTADEAVARIADGSTVAVTGSGGGLLEPDALLAALERRFLRTGGPRGLTFVHALGIGDRDRRGTNRFAHEGLTRRVIGGHWTWSPRLMELARGDRIEGYALPSGVISQLFREIGARRPGLVTRTGLGTFADPRSGGGKVNATAREDLVELLHLDGREYLRYRPFPVDVALVRGSAADRRGNITCAREPAQLDALAVAQAARASGGLVVAQVKERHSNLLDPRSVHIPYPLVDAVVVVPDQWQTYSGEYEPSLCGDAPAGEFVPDLADPVRAVIARRAALEVPDGAVLNLGFGVSSQVVDALAMEGRLDEVTLVIEQGLVDGIPFSGDLFGIARGPGAVLPSTVQFDLFSGGLLDVCCLGMAELDGTGSVNVSLLGGRPGGPGGFIDISQHARKAVFCGTFTAKGLDVAVLPQGALRIRAEGQVPKLVDRVGQVTYSGELAREEGREAVYVTERAVFRLTPEGVELTEVADGVDVQREVLDRIGFTPIVRDVRPMPREILRAASASREGPTERAGRAER